MLFKELNLIEPILKALETEGYSQPTPIQEQSIPTILKGKDLLGCAQTGTGKTAAFAIPIIQLLYNAREEDRKRGKLHARPRLGHDPVHQRRRKDHETAHLRFLRDALVEVDPRTPREIEIPPVHFGDVSNRQAPGGIFRGDADDQLRSAELPIGMGLP